MPATHTVSQGCLYVGQKTTQLLFLSVERDTQILEALLTYLFRVWQVELEGWRTSRKV